MIFTIFKKLIVSALLGVLLVGPGVVHAGELPDTSVRLAAVSKTKKAKTKAKVSVKKPVPVVPAYRASLLIASATEVKLSPDEKLTVRLGFKNTGKNSWKVREFRLLNADGAVFMTESWAATSSPVLIAGEPLLSGRLEFYDITLDAPNEPGSFTLSGQIIADGQVVSGSTVTLPVVVVPPENTTVISENLLPEPRIRVALGKTEGATAVKVSVGSYQANLLDGTSVASMIEGETAIFEYDQPSKVYGFTYGGVLTTSTQPFRLLAANSDSRFLLVDKKETAKWNNKIVYNEYRDTLEIRWSDKIVGWWMINELPIEYYLKGLIETGNSETLELHKSVYTAARTYAYIHLPDGVKYKERLWDVHAVWDQYYNGYAAEKINPNGVRAVDETRGLLITYENKPVVTPYFTRSNGSTIGWKAAWGGKDKPWLQPVVAKYDIGKKMWGHGVGMSNQDAKQRIIKDNWTHEQVLTYYYTGVQLKRVYE